MDRDNVNINILPSKAINDLAHHHLRLTEQFTDKHRKWNASQSSELPFAIGKLNTIFVFPTIYPVTVLVSNRFLRAIFTRYTRTYNVIFVICLRIKRLLVVY